MERRVIIRGRPRADRQAALVVPRRIPRAEDPFEALLDAWLAQSVATDWAVVVGTDAVARHALDEARAARDGLAVWTGSPDADALLGDLAPVLGRLLDDMTVSQRRVARLLLVDGLRQADAADALGISRASVSVAATRARVHEIGLLLRAIRAGWTAGRQLAAGDRSR